MWVIIQELDNAGEVAGVTSIEFADIYSVSASIKSVGNQKREYTLYRRSGSPYVLDPETTVIAEAPDELQSLMQAMAKNLVV